MGRTNALSRLKDLFVAVKRRNPYKISRTEAGIGIVKGDSSFNPTNEDHKGRTFIAVIHGTDSTVFEAEERADDMILEYDGKHCAITSKPLMIEGNRLYFTKNGFVGTMAYNKDTLLSGDLYQPSKGSRKRTISKDINLDEYDLDINSKGLKETDDGYEIKADALGDVEALQGSKATLKEMNKAQRLRKLLKPSKVDRQKIILAVVAGIGVGFVLYPRVMGQ